MKKKLEADLISIAHRILQLKNKSDINQLYLETQKLYEKLSVLRFVEEHFGDLKPTIGAFEIAKQIEHAFDKEELAQPETSKVIDEVKEEEVSVETPLEQITQTTAILQPATNIVVDDVISGEEIIETPIDEEEEVKESVTDEVIIAAETTEPENAPFIPAFKLEPVEETEIEQPKKEELQIVAPNKNSAVQISFEDLLGGNYHDTQFVKVQQIENIPATIVIETPKKFDSKAEVKANISKEIPEHSEPKIVSLNEKLAKNINIDLNDRIAFTKNLFGNSGEDYNRVLNQLITFDTFYETRDFILDMVKPDYNNWEGKQDYEERFMDIIEKKFL